MISLTLRSIINYTRFVSQIRRKTLLIVLSRLLCHYKILHMAWQHSYSDMCKILHRSIYQNLDDSKMKFTSNLTKIVSEIDYRSLTPGYAMVVMRPTSMKHGHLTGLGSTPEYQLQLQLRGFQLQLQLRQLPGISTPTPGISTPTPTPAIARNINSNSRGFNSNSGDCPEYQLQLQGFQPQLQLRSFKSIPTYSTNPNISIL